MYLWDVFLPPDRFEDNESTLERLADISRHLKRHFERLGKLIETWVNLGDNERL